MKLLVVIALLLSANIGIAQTLGHYVYGIDVANDLWEINPADGTMTKVALSSQVGQTANGLAYDAVRNQMF